MKHTKQWFISRINKRIFRLTKYKCCQQCDVTYKNGLIVSNKFHAKCLFMYQNDLNYEYADKKLKI